MFTRRGSRREGAEGQVLVLVAGGFIAFVAIVGLVLDGGVAFLNRREGQNAADLASMTGARVIAEHYMSGTSRTTDQIHDAVAGSLVQNNCTTAGATPCTFSATYVAAGNVLTSPVTDGSTATVPTGTIGVAVDVRRIPGTFFSSMLGFNSWTVDTVAVSTATSIRNIPPGVLLPIAACGWQSIANPGDCVRAADNPANIVQWNPGQIYDLTDGMDAPGGFGYISWSGSNTAGALATSLCNANNPGFALDDPYDSPGSPGTVGTNPATGETWFPGDPGATNANLVRACLDAWIDAGTTVLIPIYDVVQGPGNGAWYHITGVAAFVITARDQPAVDNIQGRFEAYYTLSNVPGASERPPTPADGTVDLKLVR
jgi:hypothetical protein